MSSIKKKKEDTIESKEEVDSSMSCESDPGFSTYEIPDYSSCDLPRIKFNPESFSWEEIDPFQVPSLDSIRETCDSIRTKILSRHAMATSESSEVKAETLGKYSSDDLEEMYRQGLNDGMKRAVETDSPLIEVIVKKAVDKLYKLKSAEWIILAKSLDPPGMEKIKYVCSNCETVYTRTTFSRVLPKYCENCGSKNSVRHDSELKRSW